MKNYLKLIILIFFLINNVNIFALIIPANRTIPFDPGVRGGIPFRNTIYITISDTTINAATLQSHIDNCPSNQVVQLTAGMFTNINAGLTMRSGVTLRGMGITNTTLKGTASHGDSWMIIYNAPFDTGGDGWGTAPNRALVSPTKDSTTLTTSVAHGWSEGDYVLVDMLEQPSGDPPISNEGSLGEATWVGRSLGARPIGQIVEITAVPTTTTATINPPLYWSYANTPQGTELTGWTKFAGIEDLSLDNQLSAALDTLRVQGAVNCWLYNVEVKGSQRRMIWGYVGLWNTIQKCQFRGGIPIGTDETSAYQSDRAYGPFLGMWSAGLITDTIFEKLTMGVAFEGLASGNVVSYNFITNIWWKVETDKPRRFGLLMHGPHPFMNLWEGNWSSDRFRSDEYWGTSSHFICLRNRILQHDRGTIASQTWAVDIERNNWYWSFVGNLIGDNETIYELINGESAPYEGTPAIWKIGYNSLGSDNTLYDVDTLDTMIRWGNWSFRTNDSTAGSGIVYHTPNVSDTSDTTIPISYYLSSTPNFFGILKFPAYDPSDPNSNSATNLPAGYRYFFGVDPPKLVRKGAHPINKSPTYRGGIF
jgi:hypothetical protein